MRTPAYLVRQEYITEILGWAVIVTPTFIGWRWAIPSLGFTGTWCPTKRWAESSAYWTIALNKLD